VILLSATQQILSGGFELYVDSPQILKSRFSNGLENVEIINGHKLENFDQKIEIHMLKADNGSGCHRYEIDSVRDFFIFFELILLI
jgi:hypothetical protein